MEKKGLKIFKVIVVIIILLLIIFGSIYLIDMSKKSKNEPISLEKEEQKDTNPEKTETSNTTDNEMNVVLSLEDKINDNSVWCGTFNLIWNDLKNDIVKQDIEFTPQLDIVRNLNKGTFNTSYLSDESYYKVYGTPSLDLKNEIEKAIDEKFGEKSDILDGFKWENTDERNYFLYCMLKKQFEFPNVFTQLQNDKFGDYDNVEYFGIDNNTDEVVYNQVEVLYYKGKDDFAVKLLTKNNDEVIITRGSSQDTFGSIYEEIKNESEKNQTDSEFTKRDTLKIPNITFNLKKEIKEIENKAFFFSTGEQYEIGKAIQTIKFELDKKGGKIKSEAGTMLDAVSLEVPTKPREFVVDDTFTIFLKEKEKDLPYFAAKISNIKNVQ